MKNTKKMPGIPEAATSEDKARAYLEGVIWPNGPVCPHCSGRNVYRMVAKAGSKRPGRAGLLRCRTCKRQFTVTVGTIFEGSHVPLHKWLMAVHFMTASKKGISAHQLHRMLGVTYKAAWFMCHRLRYAVTQEPVQAKLRGTVEVDETYVGGKHKNRPKSVRLRESAPPKVPVMALVQRGGKVRTFPIRSADAVTLKAAIVENVDKSARILTDGWQAYDGIGDLFKRGHDTVDHSAYQYVKAGNIHTNTVECYFSLLKRGIMGTFHHISREHLAKYCAEFAFRWNMREDTDAERAVAALAATVGKRLVYTTLQAQGAF
jgi:transposase-like protein